MKFLSKFEPQAYAIMRIIFGFLICCHGIQKLFGGLGGKQALHDPWMLVGGIVEFAGGLMVGLGLFTRIGAFVVSGEMAVAYFKVHAFRAFFPIMNAGELAVAYCFAFLYIATRGTGKWGVRKE